MAYIMKVNNTIHREWNTVLGSNMNNRPNKNEFYYPSIRFNY